MAYIMTADNLVDIGRKCIAQITKYGKGMQLCNLVKTNVTRKANQYQKWYRDPKESSFVNYGNKKYANWEEYLNSQAGKGYMGADCCGWIKGAEMGNRPGGPNTKYDAKMDLTIKDMANSCLEKTTDKGKLVPGMFMWSNDYSHCAIFSGSGKDIESAPSLDGMKEVPITYQTGKSALKNFGKLPWVDYSKYEKKATPVATTSAPKKLVTGMAITLNKCPLYSASDSKNRANTMTGTYYLWSNVVIRNRVRICSKQTWVGKSGLVTGWIDVSEIR